MIMKTDWSSRRRVETALNHREPDRVPIDLNLTINPYLGLLDYLDIHPDEEIKMDAFTEVRPHPQVLKALGVDVTYLKLHSPANWKPAPPTPDGITFDEWGIGRKPIEVSPGITLKEIVVPPLKDAKVSDLEDYPWPDPEDPGRALSLEAEARELYEGTDFALMGRFGGTVVETAANMRGWEQWMMDLLTDTEFVNALLDKIVKVQMRLDEIGLNAAGKYLSIFKLSGDDFGMQDRPIFSIKVWRQIVRPILERRWIAARRILNQIAPHVKMMMHSDGAIRPFIPDLIESGIDLLDPVQRQCPGMDIFELKRDFGDRLSFHGAVDTQHVLPFGTPEDVKQEVLTCLKALAPGGGYICGPVHNVQGDVPPRNLVALCETVQEYGRYPISI
jgi:uroporphyrinogen decarboxylase